MRGWDASSKDLRLSQYVLKHVAHHIKQATCPEDWESDADVLSWLDDYAKMQDAIPLAVAELLGVQRVAQLARQAEGEGNFWSASLRWSAAALTATTGNKQQATDLFKSCATALEQFRPRTPQQQEAKDRLELSTTVQIINAWE